VSAQLVAAGYAVDVVCQVLDLARSSYYFNPGPAADEQGLKDSLEQAAADWPTYGYRRLTKELARKHVHVNAKRVRRLMRALKLTGKKPRKRTVTTDSRHGFPRFPNLVLALVIDRPMPRAANRRQSDRWRSRGDVPW
jgi:transposase InsO family protein